MSSASNDEKGRRRRALFLEACVAESIEALEPTFSEAKLSQAESSRVLLYRRLVRQRLFGTLLQLLEKTRASVDAMAKSSFANEASLGNFEHVFSVFLNERGPKTPFLRDIIEEFTTFTLERFPATGAWRSHLRYESASFRVLAAPNDTLRVSEVDAALPLPLVRSALILALDHAVHHDEIEAMPAWLLLYRDAEFGRRVLELTRSSHAIVSALASGRALGDAIVAGRPFASSISEATYLEESAALLADLSDRGIFREP